MTPSLSAIVTSEKIQLFALMVVVAFCGTFLRPQRAALRWAVTSLLYLLAAAFGSFSAVIALIIAEFVNFLATIELRKEFDSALFLRLASRLAMFGLTVLLILLANYLSEISPDLAQYPIYVIILVRLVGWPVMALPDMGGECQTKTTSSEDALQTLLLIVAWFILAPKIQYTLWYIFITGFLALAAIRKDQFKMMALIIIGLIFFDPFFLALTIPLLFCFREEGLSHWIIPLLVSFLLLLIPYSVIDDQAWGLILGLSVIVPRGLVREEMAPPKSRKDLIGLSLMSILLPALIYVSLNSIEERLLKADERAWIPATIFLVSYAIWTALKIKAPRTMKAFFGYDYLRKPFQLAYILSMAPPSVRVADDPLKNMHISRAEEVLEREHVNLLAWLIAAALLCWGMVWLAL